MKPRRLLENVSDVIALGERLARSSEITRFDGPDHDEASTLAHCFADLEESFVKFLGEHLPRLVQARDPVEIPDLLLEIGEEFRHIIYHLRDPRFYGYLHHGDHAE